MLSRPWHSAKNSTYTFSELWFYGSELFYFLNQGFLKPVKILEIGSYEGCSAVHFSDNFLDYSESELVCVDPFDTKDTTSPVSENTKKLFMENIKKSKNGDKIHLREMYSSEFYKINNQTFDFIYIDGSHLVSDIQVDFVECLKILNDGGVLWMDDYLWGDGITIKNAIDKLYEDHKNQLKIIHKGYQIGFLKNPR